MQSVKLIDSEFLNQTVFNHVTAAGETFFSPLEDGKPSVDLTSDKVPQVAKVGTVAVKSGGYEDE